MSRDREEGARVVAGCLLGLTLGVAAWAVIAGIWWLLR